MGKRKVVKVTSAFPEATELYEAKLELEWELIPTHTHFFLENVSNVEQLKKN